MNNLTYDNLKEIYDGEKNLGDKPVVLDFYADWCGPCKMFEPIFEEVAKEYSDKVDFYKVNSEHEPRVSMMFNIMSIPTLVMISKNGDINVNPGSMNKDMLKYYIEGLLVK